ARDSSTLTVMSSVKPAHLSTGDLIRKTRELWKSRLGRDLSREDARQITENITGFFEVLAGWSRAEVSAMTNDNGEPACSHDKNPGQGAINIGANANFGRAHS